MRCCNIFSWDRTLKFEQGVLISHLNDATSVLDNVDARNCLARNTSPFPGAFTPHQLQGVVTVFSIILFAPIEYLAQFTRADLLRRAIAADIFVGFLAASEYQDISPFILQSSVILRVFVRRAFAHAGLGFDHVAKSNLAVSHASPTIPLAVPHYIEHLLNGNDNIPLSTPEYASSTLDLAEDCFACVVSILSRTRSDFLAGRMLLKDKTNNIQAITEVITLFIQMDIVSSCARNPLHFSSIKLSAFMRFVTSMTRSYSPIE